ncbi:MAG: arylamine N-acetyltransferase [Aliiglaciecola sp.]|uniref:arylamine N-acetyltransferase family protein n=1 Tax=Aliiglaciecola sp. TaxID=1872441 RepID=UPI003298A5CF
MHSPHFIAEEYLARINYVSDITVSQQSLTALHNAQIQTIPFENFDIFLGQEIKLDSQSLFNKLVRHKRGGYCFELNGLMLMALQYFGFDARALLGRVHLTGTPTGRGHQICVVTLNNTQWIVDVGFGANTPMQPLPLEFNIEFKTKDKIVRFIEHPLFGIMFQVKNNDAWDDLYSFELSHVCAGDISYGNHFTSTNPNSIFVSSRVAYLPIKNGAFTLFNYTLKKTIDNNEIIETLPAGKAYIDALKYYFGIELTASYEQLKDVNIDSNQRP